MQGKQAAAPSVTAGEDDPSGEEAEANIGPEPPGNDLIVPSAQAEKKSLLSQAAAVRKGKPEESESEKMLREEAELLRNITKQKALRGVKELAKVQIYNQLCIFQLWNCASSSSGDQ